MGCPDLIVATDHKPLVGLFEKPFTEIQNPRLLSIVEKTLWYKFRVIHVPGKVNCGPDFMSRTGEVVTTNMVDAHFSSILCTENSIDAQDSLVDTSLEATLVCALSFDKEFRAVTLERVRDATNKDGKLLQLKEIISGPSYVDRLLPEDLSEYNRYRDRLSVIGGCIVYGSRLLIPEVLRPEILRGLHSAHQGVVGMLARAKQIVFWPGLYSDLEKTRAKCIDCHNRAPSQAALPPRPIASPDYPFQQITADYCTIKSKTWLVMADRFSGWVSVYYFPHEATAKDLTKILREHFMVFGAAEEISTDSGSQFISHEFNEFLQTWGVKHRMSSEYNPHSNLRAETGVKTAKRLLMTATKSDGSPD